VNAWSRQNRSIKVLEVHVLGSLLRVAQPHRVIGDHTQAGVAGVE
jgi:hypothetical protein